MYPESFYLGKPVRSLQAMLRQISFVYSEIPRLIPDGIFEEETTRAVVAFQSKFGLPATGVVDNATWDAVVVVFHRCSTVLSRPRRADSYPSTEFTVLPGGSTVHMMVIQSMFKSLTHVLDGPHDVVVNGEHTGISVENARWLQEKAGLNQSGAFDMPTWDMLTRLYALFITRNPRLL